MRRRGAITSLWLVAIACACSSGVLGGCGGDDNGTGDAANDAMSDGPSNDVANDTKTNDVVNDTTSQDVVNGSINAFGLGTMPKPFVFQKFVRIEAVKF